MATIIDNQCISKRSPKQRKSSFNDSYYKSANFDTGISQFKQKPERSRRGKSSGKLFSPLKEAIGSMANDRRQAAASPRQTNAHRNAREDTRGKGLSFPAPPLATMAVIAAVVVISLIALGWTGISTKTPEEYTFTLAKDTNGLKEAENYANIGISAFNFGFEIPETNKKPANKTDTPDTITESTGKTSGIPPEMIESFKWSSYKVLKGDSVSGIAQKFGISKDAIIASNNIRNARQLREGAALRIPNIDGIPYQVKKGDSLSRISVIFNVPLDVILDVNDIRSDLIKEGETLFIPGARMNATDLKLALGELFIYPVRKDISSNFGWRKNPFSGAQEFHTGVDFRGNIGATVKASMDGTVSVIKTDRTYGQHIIMSHSNGYKTLYAHLSVISVKQGEKVLQGKKIGELGNTGLSTGPHLHFSIFRNEIWLNPIDLLN